MDSLNPELVQAAADGDAEAWALLVRRTQNLAMAVALGRSDHWEDACDAAQDAFETAFVRLGELREPAAFPQWLAALVRTACSRRSRRRAAVPGLEEADLPADPAADPALEVVAEEERREVGAAIESLPEPQRSVIALHYLAGLSYPEVGAFLGIGTSAAKKRAFTARHRLKEMLPMAARTLHDARPSGSTRFSDTILLFCAIRRGDTDVAARLLAGDPSLVGATENWSDEEALAAGLLYAREATPLIRAAQSGDRAMVRLLVDAGAAVDRRCECAGAETALWAATTSGEADVVADLLALGADPDAPAFCGVTPLHVAAGRGQSRIRELLLAAGADPDRRDGRGRRPEEWAATTAFGAAAGRHDELLVTGIRAVDLFAPLTRGGAQHWPPAYGLGQFVCLFEIAHALAPTRCWCVGFAHGPYDHDGFRHESRETGVDVTIALTPAGPDPDARRRDFTATLRRLASDPRPEKLVVCLQGPGHAHDVTAALPALRADASVACTLVVAPFDGRHPVVDAEVPEGFTGQVAFDPVRARRRLYPAIDPATTQTTASAGERHRRIAAAVRTRLADYLAQDPALEQPDPETFPDPARAEAAQRLLGYLAQPFAVAEPFSGRPGEQTPLAELLDTIESMV